MGTATDVGRPGLRALRGVLVVLLVVGAALATTIVPALAAEDVSLRVGAVDTEIKGLSGGVFTLHDDAGALLSTCTTDAGGACDLGPVAHGTYWLRRPTAPPGYRAEVAPVPVRLEPRCGGLCVQPPVVHNRRAYALAVEAGRTDTTDTFDVLLTDGAGPVDGATLALRWDGEGTLVGAADRRTTDCTTVGGVCSVVVEGADAFGRLIATFATAHQHAVRPDPLPSAVPDGDVAVSAIATSALPSRATSIAVEIVARAGDGAADGDLLVDGGLPVLRFSPDRPGPLAAVFDVVVTNTGEAPLREVVVTDDRLGPMVDGVTLAPGESLQLPASESFTFDDLLDAPSPVVVRVVSATGAAPDGGVASSAAEGAIELVAVAGAQDVTPDDDGSGAPAGPTRIEQDQVSAPVVLPEAGVAAVGWWLLALLLLASGAALVRGGRRALG